MDYRRAESIYGNHAKQRNQVHATHIKLKIEHIQDIVSCSFGLWISGLFSAISGWNPGITFREQEAAFFWLLKKLLEEGKVKFCPPNEFWRKGYDVWDADASTILEYLRCRWPVEASSENDRVLTNYFYEMPAILWVATDGTLHGS
jgi:hypothetical protein